MGFELHQVHRHISEIKHIAVQIREKPNKNTQSATGRNQDSAGF